MSRHCSYVLIIVKLVVKLLCGCGLRLFERLNLRVQSFKFDAWVITIRDGRGRNDRTVPPPGKAPQFLPARYAVAMFIIESNKDRLILLVPGARIELAQPYGRGILSPLLPLLTNLIDQ